jgi:MOSC domain-containing protein YiiM
MSGNVIRLSTKAKTPGEHGLPKHEVEQVAFTTDGLAGDYNHYRFTKTANDPNQAVLVLSEAVLTQLREEGWPVQPGDLGENVTLGGIPEERLRPGVQLALGQVVIELTAACDPCTELYVLPYVGKERGPDFVRTMNGRRGWYAKVLTTGIVERGSPATLLTEPAPV